MDKRAIVVAGCVAVVIFYLLVSLSTSAGEGFLQSRDPQQEGTYTPADWEGMAISYDNNLYVPHQKSTKGIRQIFYDQSIKVPHDSWSSLDLWFYDPYIKAIGWNGILEALEKGFLAQKSELPTSYTHHIGEMIAESATRPEHAMELTANNYLNRAIIHGAVWYYITEFPDVDNKTALFNFIDKHLCYYRGQVDEIIWISCAHGVGHGLARIYNDSLDPGFAVCAQHPVNDFAYGCATGVAMDLAPQLPHFAKGMAPCDTVILSQACFRFKDVIFERLGWDAKPCEDMPPLNQRGCIFSQAHAIVDDVADSELFCAKYRPSTVPSRTDFHWRNYLACLEGSWQSHEVYKQPDPQAYCNQWNEDFVRELCETHISGDEENGDYEKWNYDILEVL